jgi:hypothetical protein
MMLSDKLLKVRRWLGPQCPQPINASLVTFGLQSAFQPG